MERIDEEESDEQRGQGAAPAASTTTQQQLTMAQRMEKQKKLKSLVVNVIESLLVNCVTEAELLQKANLLSKSCFDDLTTERSLIHICGYPLCSNSLPDDKRRSRQRYHIDLNNHKVYDITERKRFCSDLCYKASTFLKEQMPDEPLWFRSLQEEDNDDHDQATVVKEYLLYRDTRGLAGVQVKLQLSD